MFAIVQVTTVLVLVYYLWKKIVNAAHGSGRVMTVWSSWRYPHVSVYTCTCQVLECATFTNTLIFIGTLTYTS